jgi:hypothetical protein
MITQCARRCEIEGVVWSGLLVGWRLMALGC